MSNNKIFSLGIEFSTQSVKLIVLDIERGDTVYKNKFDYDKEFPEYHTEGGVLKNTLPEIRHTSSYMLIESLDCVFKKLLNDSIDLNQIYIIKIDAMQHCTVYANGLFKCILKNLDSGNGLLKQLKPGITRSTIPIWEDRSPIEEVKFLTGILKKKDRLIKLTGNKAELRFPAAQIIKWAKESPEEYKATSHIFLLSAFLTSILIGKIAPVDTGDGWGTNLNTLNIKYPQWNKIVLKSIDDYLNKSSFYSPLEEKIGKMVDYDTVAGRVCNYFIKKYGVNPHATVLVGTGDNPATLLGCGGNIVISLGSSYTVNGAIKEITPSISGEYNIFGYTRGRAMALSVFTNGGKVHEHFLKKYITKSSIAEITKKDWDLYVQSVGKSEISSQDKIMLPYLLDESTPLCKKGIVRDDFKEDEKETNIRALHLSFALALKAHSSHLSKVNTLCIAAGGSKNPVLRQWISDAFNAKSYTIKNSEYAAPLGCAISGALFLTKTSYKEAVAKYVQIEKESFIKPIPENVKGMKFLITYYNELEQKHLKTWGGETLCIN